MRNGIFVITPDMTLTEIKRTFSKGYLSVKIKKPINPNLLIEDGILYNKAKTQLIFCSRKSQNFPIYLPSTLRYIHDYAFCQTNIEKINCINSEFIILGKHCFENCKKLKSIWLPDYGAIGDYAFAECTSITSIRIPRALTENRVGVHCFFGWNSKQTIYFSTNQEEIFKNIYEINFSAERKYMTDKCGKRSFKKNNAMVEEYLLNMKYEEIKERDMSFNKKAINQSFCTTKSDDKSSHQFKIANWLQKSGRTEIYSYLDKYSNFIRGYNDILYPRIMNFFPTIKLTDSGNALLLKHILMKECEFNDMNNLNISANSTRYTKVQEYSLKDLYYDLCIYYQTPNNTTSHIRKNKTSDIRSIKPKGSFINVIVRANEYRCRIREHDIYDVTIKVPIFLKNADIEYFRISGGYCPNCGTYFITKQDFQEVKKHGRIACRVVDEKMYYEQGFSTELNMESILKQYGYNVSRNDGLSKFERQRILSYIIEDGKITKAEIRQQLEHFINYNGSRNCDMSIAVSKWEEDIEFLRQYKKDTNPTFTASSIHNITYEPR